MQQELLRLCGYGETASAWKRVEAIEQNYSRFNAMVSALKVLEPFLYHSDYYLTLQNDYDLIEIRNDMLDADAFLRLDGEIVVWANEHHIELQEDGHKIAILGFMAEE